MQFRNCRHTFRIAGSAGSRPAERGVFFGASRVMRQFDFHDKMYGDVKKRVHVTLAYTMHRVSGLQAGRRMSC